MKKNQKMLLGVGALAVVGYLLWKKQQTSFTGAGQKNAIGSKIAPYGINPCGCSNSCNVYGYCSRLHQPKYIGSTYIEYVDCHTLDANGNLTCKVASTFSMP